MLQSIRHIKEITKGTFLNVNVYDIPVSNVSYDTRKLSFHRFSIFFALKGPKADGHDYIQEAYEKGIRNFVISHRVKTSGYSGANFIICDDTLVALQHWAAYRRKQLSYPLIAITGSNGKTIVKEWLAEALAEKYSVGKSPLSYNSQLGVAISLLEIEENKEIGIIEAGISKVGEMASLQEMIKPEIGLMTNIGDAHNLGFENIKQKVDEKMQLFSAAQLLIYCIDHQLIYQGVNRNYKQKTFAWGQHKKANLRILSSDTVRDMTEVKLEHDSSLFNLSIPFGSKEMFENAMHVISYLVYDGWTENEIQAVVNKFSPLPNRLEIKRGVNNCLLINDSYSSDLTSLRLALEHLDDHSADTTKVVILSDMELQKDDTFYDNISATLNDKSVDQVYAIGFPENKLNTTAKTTYYPSTKACLHSSELQELSNSTILIKGARKFKLEKIYEFLSEQAHQTRLETNLSAIAHNLNVYRSKIEPTTKIMAVVKAEAYGSGSIQMAKFLEKQKVDYLAVALIDEGVQLRKNGCRLPIMIFNVQESNLDQLWEFDLEPEVYNFSILNQLHCTSLEQDKPLKIHLKIDSGMHRLGFLSRNLKELVDVLITAKKLEIRSIFSHLAASEDIVHDDYTQSQLKQYEQFYDGITKALLEHNPALEKPLRHILNTTGIVRFPDHQYDMVRLGLGIYGIDESKEIADELIKAHTLKAKVLQIKRLEKGATTGYSRMGTAEKDTDIAIISIGYADGLMRLAGNGNHLFGVNGKHYSTIGNICMDVCMLDLGLTHEVQVGDDVLIIGPLNPVEDLAKTCQTITYEVISRLAPRIKRTYIYV